MLAAMPLAAQAQNYFGQNQVQYDNFDWHVIGTEHFLVYYYPEERRAAIDAARMAERAYARLSRILDHQFREKKPIMLFASRTDFGQNNVTGDLGEGTGGVTESLRHRMLLNFTGDYRSFEHVLTHEMVHAFQYDIFARGQAGRGLQNLAQNFPPQWFADGMAEYLSLGPHMPFTDLWMRDAALNGKLPTIEQMTRYPQRYFPYRFGHSFWTFVGQKWGDEAIGQIMNAVPIVGVERAFKRELGVSLDEIGDEWREAIQQHHLPQIANLERPRKFAQPLLTQRRSGGEIFLAPSLSADGKQVAFLSNGRFSRGEVFIDLWLGNAETGKRIKRLVKSTFDPNFEELRLLYSQSAFSPDGKSLAFTSQRQGRDVLWVMDVKKDNRRHIELPLEGVTGPSWSPDGKRLVFSGNKGGITDLYVVDVDGTNFRQLTNDVHGDLQPQWSPDGRTIAFATDRGPEADIAKLSFPHWRIATYDIERGVVEVLPNQAGLNTNPQWAPDGKSVAFVSDRDGSANLFLYDFGTREHYQLTDLIGAVHAITEYSPSITWARGADRLAFTYFENGEYTIWQVSNPRLLKKQPYRPAGQVVALTDSANGAVNAQSDAATSDSARAITSIVAADSVSAGTSPLASAFNGLVASAVKDTAAPTLNVAVRQPVSIKALLDSAELALPDTTKFTFSQYKVRFQPDYVARPSVGYAPDAYGRNVFGGTTIILSDMLGNHRLAIAGEINGRMSEAQAFLGYTNIGRRLQYTAGFSQFPYYFLSDDQLVPIPGEPDTELETQEITTYISRQLFQTTAYPLNRFTRLEFGLGMNSVARQRMSVHRKVYQRRAVTEFTRGPVEKDPALNYAEANLAYVSDNTLFGYTGPIYGRRYRFQVSPVLGNLNWIEYLADYRRYDAILFNYLTIATRAYASVSVGRDETQFQKYIARPDFVRGYDRNNLLYLSCPIIGASSVNCSAVNLLGSRVAVVNAELRFPLIRRVELGILPMTLPPLEGLFFYDAGLAWSKHQTVYGGRPANYDANTQRFPLRSYGLGLRLNLFNYALLRWDYAVPLDQTGSRRGFWTWSIWPSF